MSPKAMESRDHPQSSPKKMKPSPAQEPEESMSMESLLVQLQEALQLEVKYRGGEQPTYPTPDAGTITSGMRDGSAHVLRCLKVWYDLPSDIFFNAVSIIDRFLAKMKAQPKHLSCIAVSAFHLACSEHKHLVEERAKSGGNQIQVQEPISPIGNNNTSNTIPGGAPIFNIPEPSDLVNISQSRCSPTDLLRMQDILVTKLQISNPGAGPEEPVTALKFLRLLYAVSKSASVRLGFPDFLPENLPDYLPYQLEILTCDSVTLRYRPAEIALSLLAADFRHRSTSYALEYKHLMLEIVKECQKACNMNESFMNCLALVAALLKKYNGEGTVQHRQRLVWKLSNRTMKHLRPTEKLRGTLPTIKEQGSSNLPRMRSNSECSDQSMESLSESDSERDIMEEVGAY